MNLFNDHDLDSRVSRIKSKIDTATNPANFEQIFENGLYVAKKLLDDTLPELEYIKKQVGEENENYKEVSQAIALAAGGCVKFPVSFLSMLVQASGFKQNRALVTETKGKLIEATRLMGVISSLPMNYEARSMINDVTMIITRTERKIQGGGCFIATFAFDNYDSSEVLFLRYYRDSVLAKSIIGKTLIKVYYAISPFVVKFLGYVPYSKNFVKFIIMWVIKRMKK